MQQQKDTQLDFTGQDIYVAMDVGKKSWKTVIFTQQFEHTSFTQPPSVEVLVNYLHRHFPGGNYICVYEAGYCGFWIHDALRQQGANCIVVNPADVPTTHKEKTYKSNGVDAHKLGRNLRSGLLTPIYVPSRSSLEDRSLIRTRYHFVKKQTRCKNQIKSLLNFYGIDAPADRSDGHWSRRFIRSLEQLTLQRASGTLSLKSYLEELAYLRAMIAKLTKQIRALALEEPYRASVEYLLTIDGIGTVSAMILLTELVDIKRFSSLDHLASYCGLLPGEHSTGEEQTITGISMRRNRMLRTVLIECAWGAVRKDPALIMAFAKLSKRMPKNKAIIRIARKLLNRIRFVLLHQQPYRPLTVQS